MRGLVGNPRLLRTMNERLLLDHLLAGGPASRGDLAKAGLSWPAISHAVIGSPGVLNRATGRLDFAPNLPGWGRPGLLDKLHAELEVDLAIENDINLAALGELAFGAGQGHSNFVLLSV